MSQLIDRPASHATGRKQSGYNAKSVTQHIQKKTTGYLLDMFIDKSQVAFNLKPENMPDTLFQSCVNFETEKEMITVINEVPEIIMNQKEGSALLKYKQGTQVTMYKDQKSAKMNVTQKQMQTIVQSQEDWKNFYDQELQGYIGKYMLRKAEIQQEIEQMNIKLQVFQQMYKDKYEEMKYKDSEIMEAENSLMLLKGELERIGLMMHEIDEKQPGEVKENEIDFLRFKSELEMKEIRIMKYEKAKAEISYWLQSAEKEKAYLLEHKNSKTNEKIKELNDKIVLLSTELKHLEYILKEVEESYYYTANNFYAMEERMAIERLREENARNVKLMLEQKAALQLMNAENQSLKLKTLQKERESERDQNKIKNLTKAMNEMKDQYLAQQKYLREYQDWKQKFGNIDKFVLEMKHSFEEREGKLQSEIEIQNKKIEQYLLTIRRQAEQIIMGNERIGQQNKEIINANQEIDQLKATIIEFKYKCEEEESKAKHSEELLKTQESKIQELESKLLVLTHDIVELQNQIKNKTGMISHLKAKMDEQGQKLVKLNFDYELAKKENKRYEDQLLKQKDKFKKILEDIEREIPIKNSQIETLQSKLSGMDKIIREQELKIQAQQDKITALENPTNENRLLIEEYKQQINGLELELNDWKDKYNLEWSQKQALEVKLTETVTELKTLKDRLLSQLKGEIEGLKSQLQEEKSDNQKLGENNENQREKIQKQTQKITKFKGKIEKYKDEQEDLKQRLQSLQQQLSQKEIIQEDKQKQIIIIQQDLQKYKTEADYLRQKPVASSGGSNQDIARMNNEINKLRLELTQKQEQLEQLQAKFNEVKMAYEKATFMEKKQAQEFEETKHKLTSYLDTLIAEKNQQETIQKEKDRNYNELISQTQQSKAKEMHLVKVIFLLALKVE